MARPRSDIRPRIVDAARTRFLADGVDGASLREIAREAGTNIGMIVYYFPSKDDLFLSVIESVYEKILADIATALVADAPARERLRRALVRLGRVSDHELEVIRLLSREALLSSTRFSRIVARFMRGHVPLIMKTIADGIRDGEFDGSVPPTLLLVSVMGMGGVPQLVRRALPGIPPFSTLPGPEDLADRTLELLFRAVGRHAPETAARTTTKERHRTGAPAPRTRKPARPRKSR